MVDCDKSIDISTVKPAARVALRNDSYALHVLLPSKVDPLVSVMKVEKVPDSTYDMVGGLDQQARLPTDRCSHARARTNHPAFRAVTLARSRARALTRALPLISLSLDQGDQGGG